MLKYRIHEVAKDFGVPTKVVTQILTDYIAPPKNHMQVLETAELDVVFEYITQHNQVASLEEIFKVEPKPVAETPAKSDSEEKPKEQAKEAYEEYNEELEEAKELFEDLKEGASELGYKFDLDFDDFLEDYGFDIGYCKRFGTIVIYGNEDLCKEII